MKERRTDPISRRIDAALTAKKKRAEAEFFARKRQKTETQQELDRADAHQMAVDDVKQRRGRPWQQE